MRVRCSAFLFVFALVAVLSPLAPAVAEELTSAPINPAFLKHVEDAKAGRTTTIQGDHPTGYVPSPVDLSHLSGLISITSNRSLPALYDLRDEGLVTSVKDQNPYGTCWAFATLAAIESNLLVQTTGTARTAEMRDFSEMHLAWYAYTGDDSFTYNHTPEPGEDAVLDQGGNFIQSTALLARWTGPVNETECPYSTSERPVGDWSNYANQRHLADVHYLGGGKTSDADIKNALLTYGGVGLFFAYADKFYNAADYAYYCNDSTTINHLVLVAGWDNDFPATAFSPDAPGNGAWIVKNSWGTGWGEEGYFYLSFYDSSIAQGVVFVTDPTTTYNRVYDYDPLGWVSSFGGTSPTGWFANIFTAGSGRSTTSENLAAVSFYTSAASSVYEIYVYTGVTASQPRSGTLALGPITQTLVSPGYHTVVLPYTVPITNGQLFSVVVKLTTPGYDYPIPVEYALAGYSEKATANAGESFISSLGVTWSDITTAWNATANVCLKAFTTTSTVTPTPTTTVTPTVTHAPTVTGGGSSGGGGCSAGMFAPLALLLFVPLFLTRK